MNTTTLTKKLTEKELNTYELHHKHFGNGLFFVRHLDEEMCQTCHVGKDGIERVYLTAKDRLSVWSMTVPGEPEKVPVKILDHVSDMIAGLRRMLDEGRVVIKDQRIVSVKKAA